MAFLLGTPIKRQGGAIGKPARKHRLPAKGQRPYNSDLLSTALLSKRAIR